MASTSASAAPNTSEALKAATNGLISAIIAGLTNIANIAANFQGADGTNVDITQINNEINQLEKALGDKTLAGTGTKSTSEPSAEAKQGGKRDAKHKHGSKKHGGMMELSQVTNLGDLIKNDHDPNGYVGSFALSSLLATPPASTSGMTLSSNPAALLPSSAYNQVVPQIGGKKLKKQK